MALYLNMERSLLRKGGRKAPAMSEGDLEGLLTAALNRFVEGDGEDDLRLDTEFDGLDIKLFDALTEYPGEAPLKKVDEDLEKLQVDRENILVKDFITGTNGVPALMCYMGGDWEVPAVFFLYWDGKTFRAYYPVYGNSYNRFCKCAIGSEDDSGGKIYRKYFVVCGHEEDDEEDDEASWGEQYDPNELFEGGQILQPGDETTVELTKDNFDQFRWCNVTFNTAACIEDFSSRVVSTGPASREDYDKWWRAMNKLGSQKPEDPYAYEEDEYEDREAGPADRSIVTMRSQVLINPDSDTVSPPTPPVLRLTWDNQEGCVVVSHVDPDGVVDDEQLLAQIDGLEKVGEHRFRYTCRLGLETRITALQKVPGMVPLMELLTIYSAKCGLAVERAVFHDLMMSAVCRGDVTMEELIMR